MGLFSWFFGSDNVQTSTDNTPSVNCDGTPMVQGTYIDVEGKVYGQCDTEDACSTDLFDSDIIGIDDSISSCSFDDTFSSCSFDDSFSSFDDSW